MAHNSPSPIAYFPVPRIESGFDVCWSGYTLSPLRPDVYSLVYSLTCSTFLLDRGSLRHVRELAQHSHFHEEMLILEIPGFPAVPADLPRHSLSCGGWLILPAWRESVLGETFEVKDKESR